MLKRKKIFTASKYQDAIIILSDGHFWVGKGVGITGQTMGEVCFNTSMTGHQEIMMDPSYAGQIITFTFPHIGNVGCNAVDEESRAIFCKGLVSRAPITAPSNFRASQSFEQWLVEKGIVGICGVDTRALTRNIRDQGPRSALIYYGQQGEEIFIDNLLEQVRDFPTLLGQELAAQVTIKDAYSLNPQGKYHIVVIDFGTKKSILHYLVKNNFKITVLPALTSFTEMIALNPDGILFSNGPGDPFATFERVGQTIKEILNRNIPLFGICLGHQLLALASGLKTFKLNRGHRGANHPVKNLQTGQVEITSQNHGFCVSREVVPDHIEVTHESLFDQTIEGIRRKDKLAFGVQYHPESAPGPHDSHYLFKDFYNMIEASQRKNDDGLESATCL